MSKKQEVQTLSPKEIAKKLKQELGVKNDLAVPRVEKIKVHAGIGTYTIKANNKDFTPVVNNIMAITGQKPITSKARKAISNFKLRAGMPVGVSVTLRRKRMYDFLNKFINIVMPRIRDFRGVSVKGFDGKGNYNIGLKDCNVFPEINIENVDKPHGIGISIITSAKNNREGYVLLKAMGFPFKDEIK
ncbi:MAG: 50S ribosomal protein L5 [uncultured bacterium]|nr:MAG: 50S ribosomal protein L5 [uncultured bacterium]KKT02467.1 MAG: 50S ribosomal protein L5, large subunit ribosomal protein L5 [Candidatus Peregrinibacteria bacterium GW2011_GWF2_43_17]KKT19302.1 MAG: 50S ribosomal protein L5 [Candidatus Peregrinibacteria bacterium GW2011_GWA2_43_8]HAU40189.1 50S ribosomal protein L5 [Candidatus Peregrinibacteria bacterium]